MSNNTSFTEIDQSLRKAQEAYLAFKRWHLKQRIALMHQIADEIEALGSELIAAAQSETHLPEARLAGEKARTVFQWRSYADALYNVLDLRIDTGDPSRNPPKPDLRKTYQGLGVVAVFGASNFPFAFSTAGGDTASAIAAGCAVIAKTHPGHPKTSGIMAAAITAGIRKAGGPGGLFTEVVSNGLEEGQYLVSHPSIKAVGFTGSFTGGKALFDLANKRSEPIPVFAEMGSVNPVFLLPGRLERATVDTANQYAASLTLGVGQFCTNPGLLFVPNHPALPLFLETLRTQITGYEPAPMLHRGIASFYHRNKAGILGHEKVSLLAEAAEVSPATHGNAVVATTTAGAFAAHPALAHEVFGPFGLVITYERTEELLAVARQLEGQLTATILAEPAELESGSGLIDVLTEKCGRLLFNSFPTGVEVCPAMQHGGPFPATTDSRFTSVGPDAIKRFLRPVSYQNWSDDLLPDELKNANPLGVWRTINGQWSNSAISE